MGYLPGDLRLYDRLTARELLAYFARLRGLRGPGILIRPRRSPWSRARPTDSRTVGRETGRKSAWSRRSCTEPKLLVLDEPTSGLDPPVQQTFYELVGESKALGATIFLSSHVLSEVQHVADRVGLIRDGSLALVATVDQASALTRRQASR